MDPGRSAALIALLVFSARITFFSYFLDSLKCPRRHFFCYKAEGRGCSVALNGAVNQRELKKEMASRELLRGRMKHASAQLKNNTRLDGWCLLRNGTAMDLAILVHLFFYKRI